MRCAVEGTDGPFFEQLFQGFHPQAALVHGHGHQRRPIQSPERIRKMFDHANVIHSAWNGEQLVGLLRGWTDGAFDGYVCDLAVHPAFQKCGVGKGLLALLGLEYPEVRWVLLASPLAKDYYARVGWEALGNAWVLSRSGDAMPSYEAFTAQFAELAAKA